MFGFVGQCALPLSPSLTDLGEVKAMSPLDFVLFFFLSTLSPCFVPAGVLETLRFLRFLSTFA